VTADWWFGFLMGLAIAVMVASLVLGGARR